MEAVTRLVSESLVRHGFDHPLNYRRVHWSRWFRCESPHSLLFVPSQPGVFALAEEIANFSSSNPEAESRRPEADIPRRMLAVTQFLEDDDMAFALERMLSRQNPMQARLMSGRYFVRFVVIEDASQRRSICHALNQWIAESGEKISGIGAHFATSLEFPDVRVGTAALGRPAERSSAVGATVAGAAAPGSSSAAPQLDSGAAANLHCPAPFPSGS